jgi:hypothetical protein
MNFKIFNNILSIFMTSFLLGGFALQAMMPREGEEELPPQKKSLMKKYKEYKKGREEKKKIKRIRATLIDDKGKPILLKNLKEDEDGSIIRENLAAGQPIFDDNGNQVYRKSFRYRNDEDKKTIYVIGFDVVGIIDEKGNQKVIQVSEPTAAIVTKGIRNIPIRPEEQDQIGKEHIKMYSLADVGLSKKGSELLEQKSLSSYGGLPSSSSSLSSFGSFRSKSKRKLIMPNVYFEPEGEVPPSSSSTFMSNVPVQPSRMGVRASVLYPSAEEATGGQGSSSTGNVGPANVQVKEDQD